jgi:tellurite resistance protein TerC
VVVEYFTGYLIEKSLSVDNLVVFVLVFQALSVHANTSIRLFYGGLGTIVMRTIPILVDAALIARFEWILYMFGVFLLYLAYKTWRKRSKSTDITQSRPCDR